MHSLSSETMRPDSLYYICRTADIPEGGYRAVNLFGQAVLATKKQAVVSLDRNVCPHRGHRFTLSDSGMLPLSCPYHGRAFVSPNSAFSYFDAGGFLFASINQKDGFPFFHADHFELLRKATGPLVTSFGSVVQNVTAPFHLWMQNVMDIGHLKSVHQDFYALFDLSKPVTRTYSPNGHASSHRIKVTQETKNTYAPLYNGSFFPDYFEQLTVFPNLSVTSFLGVFYSVETIIPLGGSSVVKTEFFYNKELAGIKDKLLKETLTANTKLLEEDKAICESWAPTYSDRVSNLDLPGEARIQSYLQLLAGVAA